MEIRTLLFIELLSTFLKSIYLNQYWDWSLFSVTFERKLVKTQIFKEIYDKHDTSLITLNFV